MFNIKKLCFYCILKIFPKVSYNLYVKQPQVCYDNFSLLSDLSFPISCQQRSQNNLQTILDVQPES